MAVMDFSTHPFIVENVLDNVPRELHAIIRLTCKSFHRTLPPPNADPIIYAHSLCMYLRDHGMNECLAYVLINGCKWNLYLSSVWAKKNNREDILHMLWDRTHDITVAGVVLEGGDVDFLEHMIATGLPMNEEACDMAASSNNITCLRLLHERGCPWDVHTCRTAAGNSSSFECLKYAHEHGCPWDYEVVKSALSSRDINVVKYVIDNGCDVHGGAVADYALNYSSTEMVLFLLDRGYPWRGTRLGKQYYPELSSEIKRRGLIWSNKKY
eukprot:TRINITY_DN34470_c0_g1_i1.p1 TRINITY_DN34470_c0_g1~~TRINITY_DN34470_c0_g1_i1.p1  ORF type:complete len:269 (+),score=25.34 TRINITY_DN34470_c0_g1_i1:2-808(+)